MHAPSERLPAPPAPEPIRRLNVHVLVDLERSAEAGGHVKCWERFATAAIGHPLLDLTVHFSGERAERVALGRNVHIETHRSRFSTRKLGFIGHVPDHTDLARFHPGLARSLRGADIVHSTDGFFAFARTAEKLARRRIAPLVHSVHTDTVSYTELFTRATLQQRLRFAGVGWFLNHVLRVPARQRRKMQRRLAAHMRRSRFVLTSRVEDRAAALRAVPALRVRDLRLGLDFGLFNPARADRAMLDEAYGIPAGATLFVFAGRLDEGKNIYVLIDAVEKLVKAGRNVFLLAAGVGPARAELEKRLPKHAAATGFLSPEKLAILYASADFLALPSQVETWSMAAAEALASGLPVIADAQSGVGRFIADGGGGMLVEDEGGAAWARALEAALEKTGDGVLREQASAAARAHFPTWLQALNEDLLPVWQAAAEL